MNGSDAAKKLSIQYPPPVGPYKITPTNAAPWRNFEAARLQISVGQPNYEGAKFYALCEWASHRFASVELIVSDTLQRHNLVFERGLDKAAAWKESFREGDEWLTRNLEAIGQIRAPIITRWDDCLADGRFQEAHERMAAYFDHSAAAAAALGETISSFTKRRAVLSRQSQFERNSRDFLIEELAVFSYLCATPAIDVYAGSWFKNIFCTLRVETDPFFDAFHDDWLEVDFTRNRGYVEPRQAAGIAA